MFFCEGLGVPFEAQDGRFVDLTQGQEKVVGRVAEVS